MSEQNTVDELIQALLPDPDEPVVASLGAARLKEGKSPANIQKTIFVLTEANLYQFGAHYTRDARGRYKKARGESIIPRSEIKGVTITEKPVGKSIGTIGIALLVLGGVILLGGLIEGSAMGVVTGLFIGAAWLMVPGVLMVVHARTGGDTFLDINYEGGTIAALKEWYSDEERAAFEAALGLVSAD